MKKNGLNTLFRSVFLLLLLVTLVFASCSKQEQESITTEIEEKLLSDYENVVTTHYLDGKIVTASEINLDDENLFTVLSGEELESNVAHVIYRAFTNREKYEKFGDENNAPFRNMLAFEDEIHKYVDENDLEAYYETNGKLPDSYYFYEAEIYQKYFPGVESRGIIILFDNCGAGGGSNSTNVMPGTLPVMWPGWNNFLV